MSGVGARRAEVVAHANIALSKYWGKRAGAGNLPAVPSLSVTLAGLSTRTAVTFDEGLARDELTLGGEAAHGLPLTRASALLDVVRRAAGFTARARVISRNDFPTASGLASSASGFAALALAAVRAAGLPWDDARISDLARRSSASAARSLFGGFVELPAGPVDGGEETFLPARPVAPPSHLDLAVLVCVTTEGSKAVGSTAGMIETARRSPFYDAWLTEAPRLHGMLREALAAGDLPRVGELAESSALAMHAVAFAGGTTYVGASTLEILARLRALRSDGLPMWATMDAGPHVKVLVPAARVEESRRALAEVPGVLRIVEARPGPGAWVVES